MGKSGGKSIQSAPHDIENPNPNRCPYMQLMMDELKLNKPSPTYPSRCIFRVPHRLRCEKAVHYTPQVISIGPLHHENPSLKAMEVHKKRYLQDFLGRTNDSRLMHCFDQKKERLMHCIKKIEGQEDRLRSCYSETIDFDSGKFVQIILMDAIFIIEFLFRHWHPKLLDENDCIFGKPGMVEDVWPDLLMLENQLPFFILEDLFDPAIFKGVEGDSVLFLSHYFLTGVPTFGGQSDDWKTICFSKVEHFVDHLRKLCIAPILKKQYKGQSKPTTEFLADVGQERDHMRDNELEDVNVCELVITNKSSASTSPGASASLGSNELESDIGKDSLESMTSAAESLGTRGVAAPLVTKVVHGSAGLITSLGTLAGAAVSLVLPRGVAASWGIRSASVPLGGDVVLGASLGIREGAAAELGRDVVHSSAASLRTDVPLRASELSPLVGAAESLGPPRGPDKSLGADDISDSEGANSKGDNGLKQSAEQSKRTTPSIAKLHSAGVKFQKRLTKNLFDIQFKHGILEIPKLKTEDRTELILRNLVAFEQCVFIAPKIKNKKAFEECYISDYVGIMDQFVDSSKDVELLVKYGIVENILGGGDDALSTMINSVSTGVIYHPTKLAYDTLREKLNRFCDSKFNKNMAFLRQNYFNTPCATISFFAAVILLILTTVQTICSIISLFLA